VLVHSGDLKLDGGITATDRDRLRQLGDEGVDLLAADSTNATRRGRAGGEASVLAALGRVIADRPYRVAVALFSSHLERIRALLDHAAHAGRKVCLVGRGLHDMVDAAVRVGALRPPAGLLLDEVTAARTPRRELLLLLTGSQGESRAALGRISSRAHPQLELQAGDTVVLSSRPVPGNERQVERVVDRLLAAEIEVLDGDEFHVSGHAYREELVELMHLVRPRALLPLHGGRRQLFAHARLAESEGIAAIRAVDGDVIEVDDEGARIADRVPAGRLAIEGTLVGETDADTLKARMQLARTGVVIVARIAGRLRVETYAVAHPGALNETVRAAERAAAEAAKDPGGVDETTAVRRAVARVFQAQRGVKPRVIVIL
jgi:ribonuclease J